MDANLTAGPVNSPVASAVAPPAGSRRGRRLPVREPVGLRLLGVPVWQVVAAEVLLGAAAAAWAPGNRPLSAVVAALTAIGLGLLVGRRRRRPLLAWVPVALRRWARRRRPPAAPDGDPRLAPLRELVPALTLGDVPLRSGERLAVCFDGSGWSAVLALHRDADLVPRLAVPPRLPMAALASVLQVDDIPLAAVQVLVHTTPAPDDRLPDACPAVQGYRQLGGQRVPAARRTFVVLRLDPRTAADAVHARGGGSEGAGRALRRCASRLLQALDAAQVPARPLSEPTWLAAVLDVGGLSDVADDAAAAAPGTGGPHSGRWTLEGRRRWAAGDLTHVTWWVRGFPDTASPLQTFVNVVGAVPAAAGTVSLTLHPGPAGAVRCRALLRTSARSQQAAEAAAAELRDRATALGVALQRLDGEQGPGYLCTLPLGGGAS